jgi:hypothetical protein
MLIVQVVCRWFLLGVSFGLESAAVYDARTGPSAAVPLDTWTWKIPFHPFLTIDEKGPARYNFPCLKSSITLLSKSG